MTNYDEIAREIEAEHSGAPILWTCSHALTALRIAHAAGVAEEKERCARLEAEIERKDAALRRAETCIGRLWDSLREGDAGGGRVAMEGEKDRAEWAIREALTKEPSNG